MHQNLEHKGAEAAARATNNSKLDCYTIKAELIGYSSFIY
jgi:hypothetical protein